jgi:hypothetical protein
MRKGTTKPAAEAAVVEAASEHGAAFVVDVMERYVEGMAVALEREAANTLAPRVARHAKEALLHALRCLEVLEREISG